VADGTRTRDHRDHNPGLYQLSYRHRAPTSYPCADGAFSLTVSDRERNDLEPVDVDQPAVGDLQ
jgi:hypothetical protein